ncbi:hypothetical protein BH23GEM4_BH23GEM4_23960 [soil metagenome]
MSAASTATRSYASDRNRNSLFASNAIHCTGDLPQQMSSHSPVTAATDDRGTVEPAQEAGKRRVGLRVQCLVIEHERQRIICESVAPSKDKAPARFDLCDPEARHRLTNVPGELGGALRRVATKETRELLAAAHLAPQDLQQPFPNSIGRGLNLLTVLIGVRQGFHRSWRHWELSNRADAYRASLDRPNVRLPADTRGHPPLVGIIGCHPRKRQTQSP